MLTLDPGACILCFHTKKTFPCYQFIVCIASTVAEYALRCMKAPIGVSEYTLSKGLPKELKISLPTIEEIEAELNDVTDKK